MELLLELLLEVLLEVLPALFLELQAAGQRLQPTNYRLQAAGCQLQATSYRLQATGYKLQATGCRLQAAGCKLQDENKFVLKGAGVQPLLLSTFGEALLSLVSFFSAAHHVWGTPQGSFKSFTAFWGVKRGLKMILSHMAPSCLNLSSYQAI